VKGIQKAIQDYKASKTKKKEKIQDAF